ncbi:MAG TPA: hypothetical protein VFT45_01220 [Longimicrobium sp.]|nr:hypothetical protein [Longimicrobium sp.]
MISAVLNDLANAAAEGRLVSVVRREPLLKLSGFPLTLGSRLLLLREVNAELLLPDGFAVVRLQDVAEVRCTEWEQAVQRALAGESRLPDPADTPAVRLDGWAGMLADLHAGGEPVSLECEDDEDAYFLGIITAVGAESVDLLHVSADGRYDDEPWTVDHDGITRVVFRSRYVQVFSRLAGDPDPHDPDDERKP